MSALALQLVDPSLDITFLINMSIALYLCAAFVFVLMLVSVDENSEEFEEFVTAVFDS